MAIGPVQLIVLGVKHPEFHGEISNLTQDEAIEIGSTVAALILLEHHWAVPLRDAVVRAGGFRISDGFISPLDLVEIGLLSAGA